VEIEASPELSNLDEAAFRPVESGVSVRQIVSLTRQSVEIGEEEVLAFNDQVPITQEAPAMESEYVVAAAADARPVRSNSETNQAFTRAEDENESKNGFFTPPEMDHAPRATVAKRGAASKGATARGATQQMRFNWS
jgi:hypothetical protein